MGGNGYIGSHLVEELLRKGRSVRVCCRRLPGLLPPAVLADPLLECVPGDLLDPSFCSDVLDGCSAVVHCIGPTIPFASNADPILDWHQHVEPTMVFLSVMREASPRRFLFLSSGGTVYGPNCETPTPETTLCRPISAYGVHKLSIENFLYSEHFLYGLDYVVARIANPYGGRQRSEALQGAPSVFLSKILNGEFIDLWGAGEIKRDFVHISDVIAALIQMLGYQGPSRVFNIGSSRSLSIKHLISQIEVLSGKKALIKVFPSRPFDVPVNHLDISLATKELEWSPRLELNEGIEICLQQLRGSENGQ
ncbi:NAD-dependent epimerase/dehydratase family protein [Synechococcus sp. AH-229-G18]|nr:NAD-dependent epimerase/dehydratase family protein [Synechococcus sp. AH-229-G18]